MGFNDYLQLAIELLALAGFGLGAANRWATANHRDRLAMFTSGAANAAGRIRLELSGLPPGADPAAARSQLVGVAANALVGEFAQTAQRLGATPEKAALMILAHLAAPGVPPGGASARASGDARSLASETAAPAAALP